MKGKEATHICQAWEKCSQDLGCHHIRPHALNVNCDKPCGKNEKPLRYSKCREATDEELVFHKMVGVVDDGSE